MSDRRATILASAQEILAEHGMSGLSVRAVAARAGIGASTLRHYFPTQRDLFAAVLASAFDANLHDLRIRDASVPPRERLTECLRQFLPVTPVPGQTIEGWFELIVSLAGQDAAPETRIAWSSFVTRARERVTGWLEILDGEDAVRPGACEGHALLLLALIDGLALWRVLPDGRLEPEVEARLFDDALSAVLL